MLGRVEKLSATTVGSIYPACLNSVFWELDATVAKKLTTRQDRAFEKEAWLNTLLLDSQGCGFNIFTDKPEAVATILYCTQAQALGVSQLPTAPATSENTALITSLHIEESIANVGLESLLIDAVLYEMMSTGIKEVEAFGYYPVPEDPDRQRAEDATCREIACQAQSNGLISVDTLMAAGFKVIRDHSVIPRLRLELPPPHPLLSAENAEEILSWATA